MSRLPLPPLLPIKRRIKFFVVPTMSSVVSTISSTFAAGKALPLQLYKKPSLFLYHGASALKKPLSYPPMLLADQPPHSPDSPANSSTDFPNRKQILQSFVTLEVPEISTAPEADPPATRHDLSSDPPPLGPGPNPGPEFPVPPLPPPPGPEMPIPPTPSPQAPDIPFPKPPEVDPPNPGPPFPARPDELPLPQPEVIPPRPPCPEIVPSQSPPQSTPPTC